MISGSIISCINYEFCRVRVAGTGDAAAAKAGITGKSPTSLGQSSRSAPGSGGLGRSPHGSGAPHPGADKPHRDGGPPSIGGGAGRWSDAHQLHVECTHPGGEVPELCGALYDAEQRPPSGHLRVLVLAFKFTAKMATRPAAEMHRDDIAVSRRYQPAWMTNHASRSPNSKCRSRNLRTRWNGAGRRPWRRRRPWASAEF